MSVQPIPDDRPNASPYITVRGADEAIEFYKQAFGATEELRLVDSGGNVVHAEIRIGDSVIMITDEFPEWGNQGPISLGGSPVRIHLYVEDPDAVAERAVAAGAELVIPVDDQFYGERTGRVKDPFGHSWIIAAHVEDMTGEEMQRRCGEFLEQMGGE